MYSKTIILLILMFSHCSETQKDKTDIFSINRFLLVNFDPNSAESDDNRHSRKILLDLVKKMKNNRPSLVYLNYFFVNEVVSMPNFSKELNENGKTISLLMKQKDHSIIDVKKYLGSKIKGIDQNFLLYPFHNVGSFQLPVHGLLENSEFLCFSTIFNISSSKENYIALSPYVNSNNILIESCPFALSKKILLDYYGIELEFEIETGYFNAFEKKGERSIIFTKYSKVYEEIGMFPVKIFEFKEINYRKITDAKIKVEKDMVVFIGSKEKIIQNTYFKKVNILEAEASFVYMFVNDILEKFIEEYPDYDPTTTTPHPK